MNALSWERIDETAVGLGLFRLTNSFRAQVREATRILFIDSSPNNFALPSQHSFGETCVPREDDALVDYANWKLQFFL